MGHTQVRKRVPQDIVLRTDNGSGVIVEEADLKDASRNAALDGRDLLLVRCRAEHEQHCNAGEHRHDRQTYEGRKTSKGEEQRTDDAAQ